MNLKRKTLCSQTWPTLQNVIGAALTSLVLLVLAAEQDDLAYLGQISVMGPNYMSPMSVCPCMYLSYLQHQVLASSNAVGWDWLQTHGSS